MKKISRRSFLKVSGTMAAAGALAACGGSSSTSTAASSEAAPSVEAKAVDGLPDMSKETLNFSSDKVGSGSYNMIVAMSKVLEKAGGFQTVNVNPDSPGGMGAPYLFASGNTDLAFINGAPAKWAMEEGTLGKPATSGYAAVIGGLTAVCYINCVSNAFLQKYNVSTIEEIFEQKLPLRIVGVRCRRAAAYCRDVAGVVVGIGVAVDARAIGLAVIHARDQHRSRVRAVAVQIRVVPVYEGCAVERQAPAGQTLQRIVSVRIAAVCRELHTRQLAVIGIIGVAVSPPVSERTVPCRAYHVPDVLDAVRAVIRCRIELHRI